MEDTFFNDYKARLELDNTLMKMRREFQVYKERLSRVLIERYNVTPATSAVSLRALVGPAPPRPLKFNLHAVYH
jgi:hypothetical protein